MGRETRRVPKDWIHPRDDMGRLKPLHDGRTLQSRIDGWNSDVAERGLQGAIEWGGGPPDARDYMPAWTEEQADHLMMYETTSEGTPLSPAFKTKEELARWLADNGASALGDQTATYEQWLAMCRAGWAPSAVISEGVMKSGVAATGTKDGAQ